jgi:hypothetical protein
VPLLLPLLLPVPMLDRHVGVVVDVVEVETRMLGRETTKLCFLFFCFPSFFHFNHATHF